MIVKDIPPITIFRKTYELAKAELPEYPNNRGRKGFKLAVRVAILTYISLYHLTPEQCVRELMRTKLGKELGLEKIPGVSTIYRWRSQLSDYVHTLIREAFMLAREQLGVSNMTVIADGSGAKIGRGTPYYEWRKEKFRTRRRKRKRKVRRRKDGKCTKRKKFVRQVISYVLELDMIFSITATSSSVGELKAFIDGHLDDIIESRLFGRFIADSLYDAEHLIKRLVSGGIEVCIPARSGKLTPKPGTLRYDADKNYEDMRQDKHLRNLVESAYSSLKSRSLPYVTGRSWKSREMEVIIYALIYNVARLYRYGLI